jgi:hypothetical protein
MDRPIPFDYLVLLWATVPWLWTDARLVRRRQAALRWPHLVRQRWRRRLRRSSVEMWTRGG